MKRSSSFLRTLSFILLQTFILQQVSFADIRPLVLKHDLNAKPPVGLNFPASVATIEDAYLAPRVIASEAKQSMLDRHERQKGGALAMTSGEKTLYLIQDAHTNESGQYNLSSALSIILNEEKDLNLVFTEAGIGDNSLSFLRSYKPLNERTQLSKEYIRKGILHGAEYLQLTTEADFILWGVEDIALYKKAVEDYRTVHKERDRLSLYLKKINATLQTLNDRFLNPSLAGFLKEKESYLKDKIALTAYFTVLLREAELNNIDLGPYSHLRILKDLKAKEDALDFIKANQEHEKALLSLPADIQKELKDLTESSQNKPDRVLSGSQDQMAYFARLEEVLTQSVIARSPQGDEAISAGWTRNDYKELFKYFDYLKLARSLRAKNVLSEIKALEGRILGYLAQSQDEKDLVKAREVLRYLEKLFSFTLTPEEYGEYKQLTGVIFDIQHLTGFLNKKIMDLETYYDRALFLEEGYDDILGRAQSFYDLTLKRDEHFLKEALSKMNKENQKKAVLITGGFHTKNLKEMLKSKGISFISVTPQVFHETNLKRYEEILLGQSLDKLSSPVTSRPSMATAMPWAILTNPYPPAREAMVDLRKATADLSVSEQAVGARLANRQPLLLGAAMKQISKFVDDNRQYGGTILVGPINGKRVRLFEISRTNGKTKNDVAAHLRNLAAKTFLLNQDGIYLEIIPQVGSRLAAGGNPTLAVVNMWRASLRAMLESKTPLAAYSEWLKMFDGKPGFNRPYRYSTDPKTLLAYLDLLAGDLGNPSAFLTDPAGFFVRRIILYSVYPALLWAETVTFPGGPVSGPPSADSIAKSSLDETTERVGARLAKINWVKHIYDFGAGRTTGNAGMRDLLGGKGANLAEMASLGLPVPPGFTIDTVATHAYLKEGNQLPSGLWKAVKGALKRLEAVRGKKLGDANDPLLVSVRSGAKESMPGMMDTILNVGLNDVSVEGLAKVSANPRFAYDSYRRLLQMFGATAMGAEGLHEVFDDYKHQLGVESDTELDVDQLKGVVPVLKAAILEATGREFPQDPSEQLRLATEAVFRSSNNDRAHVYRKLHNIPSDVVSAVNIQSMTFGNFGDDSATGVAFTRDTATGQNRFNGEFLINAQGEDVVAGIRTPLSIEALKEKMPQAYAELEGIYQKLERHFRDAQDIEFTIERGKLFMLQTRNAKRTAAAMINIAADLVKEGLITKEEALRRLDLSKIAELSYPRLDPQAAESTQEIAAGMNASPGAAVGRVVFSSQDAEIWSGRGEKVILVRDETSPDDLRGMIASEGILTARGGMTSHAALVARGQGTPAVVGVKGLVIDLKTKTFTALGERIAEGDWITIDGTTGKVYRGQLPTADSEIEQVERGMIRPEDSLIYRNYSKLLSWADEIRRMEVWANADDPAAAAIARKLGAQGIGLARTEHMFAQSDRIMPVQAMFLAEEGSLERDRILTQIGAMQREDFEGILKVMQGLPVTIRLLDPPIHEFLPKPADVDYDAKIQQIARLLNVTPDEVRRRIDNAHEINPMLGSRGVRLLLDSPSILRMQVRAMVTAYADLANNGVGTALKIMVPNVINVQEFVQARAVIRQVMEEVFNEKNVAAKDRDIEIGVMIETPAAALTTEAIAKEADFFSFGTNDLTQGTFMLSRDDAARSLLPLYLEKGILEFDPTQRLDATAVYRLIRMAVEEGRQADPNLTIGCCGEHGGEPNSIFLFEKAGLTYVSASPLRLPVARLAAAQATLSLASGARLPVQEKESKQERPLDVNELKSEIEKFLTHEDAGAFSDRLERLYFIAGKFEKNKESLQRYVDENGEQARALIVKLNDHLREKNPFVLDRTLEILRVFFPTAIQKGLFGRDGEFIENFIANLDGNLANIDLLNIPENSTLILEYLFGRLPKNFFAQNSGLVDRVVRKLNRNQRFLQNLGIERYFYRKILRADDTRLRLYSTRLLRALLPKQAEHSIIYDKDFRKKLQDDTKLNLEYKSPGPGAAKRSEDVRKESLALLKALEGARLASGIDAIPDANVMGLEVRSGVAKRFGDLFDEKRVNGRHINVAGLIGDMTRRYKDDFYAALKERADFLRDVERGDADYGFLDENRLIWDADQNRSSVRDIRQGMLDNARRVKSDLAWRLSPRVPIPDEVLKPGLQGTGPADDVGMLMNAMNTGKDGGVSWMFDWEDAGNDFGDKFYRAWRNLRQLVHGQWDNRGHAYFHPTKNKTYRITVPVDQEPVVFHRVPGLHLRNRQIKLDGENIPAIIPALVIYTLNNYDFLKARGHGVYFYVPKIETVEEAKLISNLLRYLEEAIDVPRGTIKIEMLNERARYAASQEAIMWVLRENLIGPNVGRWDYINSRIEMMKDSPSVILPFGTFNEGVFPDPHTVAMTEASMTEYTRRNAILTALVEGFPIGGMSAVMRNPKQLQVDAKAERSIRFDKLRERLTGLVVIYGKNYDLYRQSWVATTEKSYVRAGAEPLQVPVGKELQALVDHTTEAEKATLLRLGLIDAEGRITPFVATEAYLNNLFDKEAFGRLFDVPKGEITEEGLRYAIYMASEYMFQQLNGNNAAAIDDYMTGNRLMNDFATYEIFWHWLWTVLKHGVSITGENKDIPARYTRVGDKVTSELIKKLLDERRQTVRDFFAAQDSQGVKSQFDRTLGPVAMDILERQLFHDRWITYGSRVLLSVIEKSEAERKEILDAIFSDRSSVDAAVEAGTIGKEALVAHDFVYDVFKEKTAGSRLATEPARDFPAQASGARMAASPERAALETSIDTAIEARLRGAAISVRAYGRSEEEWSIRAYLSRVVKGEIDFDKDVFNRVEGLPDADISKQTEFLEAYRGKGIPFVRVAGDTVRALALSAKISQLAGLVPIIETETFLDKEHEIQILVKELDRERVFRDGVVFDTGAAGYRILDETGALTDAPSVPTSDQRPATRDERLATREKGMVSDRLSLLASPQSLVASPQSPVPAGARLAGEEKILSFAAGFELTPTFATFQDSGLMDLFRNNPKLTGKDILSGARSLKGHANKGYIFEALHELVLVRWLDRDLKQDPVTATYTLTPEGEYALRYADRYYKAYGFMPAFFEINDYLRKLPEDRTLPRSFGHFRELIDLSLADWHIPAAQNDLEKRVRDQILDHLNGFIVAPLLVALRRSDEDKLLNVDFTTPFKVADIGRNTELFNEIFRLLASPRIGWVSVTAEGVMELTPEGRVAWQKVPALEESVSHAPLYRERAHLLFGADPASVIHRGGWHRKTHVYLSISTGDFFLAAADSAVGYFRSLDAKKRPRFIVDVGGVDKGLAEAVYRRLKEELGEEAVADLHIVVADTSPQTIAHAKANLLRAGASKRRVHALLADIMNPEVFGQQLAKLFPVEKYGFLPSDGFFMSSMLIHNRPLRVPHQAYLERVEEDEAVFDRPRSEHVWVSREGEIISNGWLQQSLIRLLGRWGELASKHGALIIEFHIPSVSAIRGESAAGPAYYSTHANTGLVPVEFSVYADALRRAHGVIRSQSTFPSSAPSDQEVAVSVTHAKFLDIHAIASEIKQAYDRYYEIDEEISNRALSRFVRRQWFESDKDQRERVLLYSKHLNETRQWVARELGNRVEDTEIWNALKAYYWHKTTPSLYDRDLARTFFYSVMRRVLVEREGVISTEEPDDGIEGMRWPIMDRLFKVSPVRKEYRISENKSVREMLGDIFEDLPKEFYGRLNQKDLEDSLNKAAEKLEKSLGDDLQKGHIEILSSIFYRNKGAYLLGRLVSPTGKVVKPVVFPFFHPDQEGIRLHAVLTDFAVVNGIFNSSRANFRVPGLGARNGKIYREVLMFLWTLIPERDLSVVLSAIGFTHPGKIRFLQRMRDFVKPGVRFQKTPGYEGNLMVTFLAPGFPFVFKVIRETALRREGVADPKFSRSSEELHDFVAEKYRLASQANRVGHKLDAMKFFKIAFRKSNFSDELLDIFKREFKSHVRIVWNEQAREEMVIFEDLYVQSQVTPLTVYLADKNVPLSDKLKGVKGAIRALIELGQGGIFIGDPNLRNFGITGDGRIVNFDNDDMQPLESLGFIDMQDDVRRSMGLDPTEKLLVMKQRYKNPAYITNNYPDRAVQTEDDVVVPDYNMFDSIAGYLDIILKDVNSGQKEDPAGEFPTRQEVLDVIRYFENTLEKAGFWEDIRERLITRKNLPQFFPYPESEYLRQPSNAAAGLPQAPSRVVEAAAKGVFEPMGLPILLIVENDAQVRRYYLEDILTNSDLSLSRDHFQIVQAEDYESAARALDIAGQKGRLGLVITNSFFPDRTPEGEEAGWKDAGLKVLRKAGNVAPKVPVIFVGSGEKPEEVNEAFFVQRTNDTRQKPSERIPAGTLLVSIRAALNAQESNAGARLAEAERISPDWTKKPSKSAEAYALVTRLRWYLENMGKAMPEEVVRGLDRDAVVLDASTGTGAGSEELANKLRRNNQSVKRLLAADVGFPLAREFIDVAVHALARHPGVFRSIEHYILPWDPAAKTYLAPSTIPGIQEDKVDLILFMNAIHLLSPAQRASTLSAFFEISKPGGVLAIGSAGLENPARRDVQHTVLLDSLFEKVHDQLFKIVKDDDSYEDLRASFSDPKTQEKRKKFIPTPPAADDVIRALTEAGFEIVRHEPSLTTLKRDELRPFITGVDSYVDMAFPELISLPPAGKKNLLSEAYDKVFDEQPEGVFNMFWTSIIARRPAGARLAEADRRVDLARTAVVFPPADGRPKVGGKDIYDKYGYVREIYGTMNAAARKLLGDEFDLFSPRNEIEYYVSLAAHKIALWEVFKNEELKGRKPAAVLGISQGNIPAFYAAGILDAAMAVEITVRNAQFLQAASDLAGHRRMALVLGVPYEKLQPILQRHGGLVTIHMSNARFIISAGTEGPDNKMQAIEQEIGRLEIKPAPRLLYSGVGVASHDPHLVYLNGVNGVNTDLAAAHEKYLADGFWSRVKVPSADINLYSGVYPGERIVTKNDVLKALRSFISEPIPVDVFQALTRDEIGIESFLFFGGMDPFTPAQVKEGLLPEDIRSRSAINGAQVLDLLDHAAPSDLPASLSGTGARLAVDGARLAAVSSPETSRERFFLNVGADLSRGFQGELPLVRDDRTRVRILSLTKDNQDILVVVDKDTHEQYTYDVSKQALTKLHEEERHDLSQAPDITDEAFGLHEANSIPVSTSTQPTAKVVLVDSFPDLSNNAFYQNLILRFGQTLAQGSRVVLVSQEDGKAEKIAALARTLGVKNHSQFVAMKKEDLSKLTLPASYLLADTYLDRARTLYGKDQKYFLLESPKEKNLLGVYAFRPIGALMDLVSLGDWEHAARLYSQVIGQDVNASELQAVLRGALLIPFVSKLIGRLLAQVYMAERAIGSAA